MSDNTTPQDNDSTKTGTVSIRNMPLEVWYKASYVCKLRGERLSDYIARLVTLDVAAYEDASNRK